MKEKRAPPLPLRGSGGRWREMPQRVLHLLSRLVHRSCQTGSAGESARNETLCVGIADGEGQCVGKHAYRYSRVAEEESEPMVFTKPLEAKFSLFVSFFFWYAKSTLVLADYYSRAQKIHILSLERKLLAVWQINLEVRQLY